MLSHAFPALAEPSACPSCSLDRASSQGGPSHGAVGRPQAVAAIDRWSQTIQYEYLEPWMLFLSIPALQRRLDRFCAYASRHRPHQGLDGRSPEEVHRGKPLRHPVPLARVAGLERSSFRNDTRLPVYRLVRAA